MNIYTLSPSTVARGVEAFRVAVAQYLGSSRAQREGGAEIIPGAIAAAIRAGINDERTIRNVVGRISRCRPEAVSAVLHGLSQNNVAGRLWAREANGTFTPRGSLNRAPAAFLSN